MLRGFSILDGLLNDAMSKCKLFLTISCNTPSDDFGFRFYVLLLSFVGVPYGG